MCVTFRVRLSLIALLKNATTTFLPAIPYAPYSAVRFLFLCSSLSRYPVYSFTGLMVHFSCLTKMQAPRRPFTLLVPSHSFQSSLHYHRTHWPLVKGDRHKVLPIHPIRPGSQIEAQLLFLLILIFG